MKKWLKQKYRELPIVRELRQIQVSISQSNMVQINSFFQRELATAKYKDPKKLNHYERQVFSQNGEDGIINEIFRRIGVKSRHFVEFGVGNGLENNTAFLLGQGWRGSWIEGDASLAREIQSKLGGYLKKGGLNFLNSFITAENIESLFKQMDVPVEFDLLSLDIDRNTYHVWKALKAFKPRVVVVEYNAIFPSSVKWIAKYDAARVWNMTSYWGASLKAYEELGEELGYALVGCDFSGTNAFFVKRSEDLEMFSKPFTAENHHEPPRYWSGRREAHDRCLDDSQ